MTTLKEPGFANNSYSVMKRDSSFDKLLALKNPPEFTCLVNGQSLIAKLTGMVNSPVEYMLMVEFSNGITDLFYIPYGAREDMSFAGNKRNIAYAKAISEKLSKLLWQNMSKFGKD